MNEYNTSINGRIIRKWASQRKSYQPCLLLCDTIVYLNKNLHTRRVLDRERRECNNVERPLGTLTTAFQQMISAIFSALYIPEVMISSTRTFPLSQVNHDVSSRLSQTESSSNHLQKQSNQLAFIKTGSKKDISKSAHIWKEWPSPDPDLLQNIV